MLEAYGMLPAAKAVCRTHLEKIATDTAFRIIASPTRMMSPKRQHKVESAAVQSKTPSPFQLHALEGNINYGRIEEYQAVQASSPNPTHQFTYPAAYPTSTPQLASPDMSSPSSSEVYKPLLSSRSVSVLEEEETPPEGTKLVHITPYIYSCVSNAECLGERSSWLACLLGRRFRSFGYLGLSTALPGTMIPVATGVPVPPSSGTVAKRDPSTNEVAPTPKKVVSQHRQTRFTYAPHLPPTPKDETVVRAPLPQCFVQDDGLIDRILATGTADLRMDERRGLTNQSTDKRGTGDDDWREEVEGPRVRLPIPKSHIRVRRPGRVQSIAAASVGGPTEKEGPSDIPTPFVREYDSSLRRANRRRVSPSPLQRSPRRERSPRAHAQTQPSPDPHTPTRPLWVPRSVPRPSTSPRISCSGHKSSLILPTL